MSPGMNRTSILAALVPLFICAGLSAGQDATLPGQEQLAKGIAALRAGDLDSAERIFTLALHQGVRSPPRLSQSGRYCAGARSTRAGRCKIP
jgi:hypothetical protein